MAVAKLKQMPKRGPLGFATKVGIAIVLGLSFAVIWSTFSPTSSEADVSSKRNSFEGEILEPESKVPTPGKAKGEGKERQKERDASSEKSSSNATVEVSNPEGETLKGNEAVVEVKEGREEEQREEGREEETREEHGEGVEQGDGENNEEQSGIEPLIPFFLFYLVMYCSGMRIWWYQIVSGTQCPS